MKASMSKRDFLPFWRIKLEAKQHLKITVPFWVKGMIALVVFQLVFAFLQSEAGGALGYYIFRLQEHPEAVSGIFPVADGYHIILRAEPAGLLLAMPVTYQFLLTASAVGLGVTLLLSPLELGVVQNIWQAGRGLRKKTSLKELLRWYTNPSLAGKTVLLSFVRWLFGRLVHLVFLAGLFYAVLPWVFAGTGTEYSSLKFMAFFSFILLWYLVYFFVKSLFAPLNYCLVTHPEYKLGMVLRKGFGSLKGYRLRYFSLQISFVLWQMAEKMTLGTLALYTFPYRTLADYVFFQTVAKVQAKPLIRPCREDAAPSFEHWA